MRIERGVRRLLVIASVLTVPVAGVVVLDEIPIAGQAVKSAAAG